MNLFVKNQNTVVLMFEEKSTSLNDIDFFNIFDAVFRYYLLNDSSWLKNILIFLIKLIDSIFMRLLSMLRDKIFHLFLIFLKEITTIDLWLRQ